MPTHLLLVLLTLLSGCGIYKSKITAPGPEVAALSAEEIGYPEVQRRIFQPSCVECHRSGFAEHGVRLDTSAEVRAHLNDIYQAVVVERSMPPDGPLPEPRIQELSDWIGRGAPAVATAGTTVRTASPSPSPSATPAFVRGSLTYRDLQDKVITPQCARCHNETRARGNVRLDNEESVRANLDRIRETVLEKRTMPPKPMPAVMHEYLREWLDLGAPQARATWTSRLLAMLGGAEAWAAKPTGKAAKASPSPVVPSPTAAPGTVYREKDGLIDFYSIGKPSMLKVHGTSTALTGTIERSGESIQGRFTLPMQDLKTGGMKLRDQHLHEKVFETSKYPTSELTLEPLTLKPDQDLPFRGKLRFHGAEKDVAGTVRLKPADDRIGYRAEFKIKQSDFGIRPPEYMGMSMQDEVSVEVQGEAEK